MDVMKRMQQSWCPYCRQRAGIDCANKAVTRKTARAKTKQTWGKDVKEWRSGREDSRAIRG